MLLTLLKGNYSMEEIFAEILAVLLIVFLILPFHEWAHAFTASCLGDKGVKARGRLSLNPLSHIDPIGAVMLLLIGFGWAKPVPVDPSKFKRPKLGMAITALMGPVANVLAASVGMFFYKLIYFNVPEWLITIDGYSYHYTVLYYFLAFYVSVNISLAVFNLIPIPPLDGSKVMFLFLPNTAVNFFYRYQNVFFIILFALMWGGALNGVLSFFTNWIYDGLNWLTELPFKPFIS